MTALLQINKGKYRGDQEEFGQKELKQEQIDLRGNRLFLKNSYLLTQCFQLKNLMIYIRYIKIGEEREANMFIPATILCRLSAFIMCYFVMK